MEGERGGKEESGGKCIVQLKTIKNKIMGGKRSLSSEATSGLASQMSQWIPLRHTNAASLFSKQVIKCTMSS